VNRERLDRAAPAALVVLALVAAYAGSFGGGYQFDDWNVIVREAGAQSPAAWWASQPGIRPLLKLSYALNRASPFGLAGFHLVNLAVHLGNTLLVAALLRGLVAPERRDAVHRRAAWIGAALFALHPVQTEAVTYLSGRSTSLAAFFALASLVLGLRGLDDSARRRWPLLSLASFALALLCKEYVAVLRRAAGPALLVFAALAAALAVPRYRVLLETSLATRDLGANLATQAHGILYLVGQMLWPAQLNADPALPARSGFDAASIACAVLIAGAVAIGLVALRRRHAVVGFALLWFLLWLAPTHSLLARLDVANDRQLYLALVGPAWALAHALARVPAAGWRAAAIVGLAVALGSTTALRHRVYADELGYWADVATKSPHNARAYANLGHALQLACRPDDARAAFEVALQLDPGHERAAVNLWLVDHAAASPGELGRMTCPDSSHRTRGQPQ
jgi:hypothetical protein